MSKRCIEGVLMALLHVCCMKVDLEFRKQWDKLVITLDVVDKDEESGTEVVHWVMHYPVSSFGFHSFSELFVQRCLYFFQTRPKFCCINRCCFSLLLMNLIR